MWSRRDESRHRAVITEMSAVMGGGVVGGGGGFGGFPGVPDDLGLSALTIAEIVMNFVTF